MKRQFLCLTLITTAVLIGAQSSGPKTFSSATEARDALVQAAAGGMDALRDLLGPRSAEILTTGDAVQDKNIVERFQRQTAEKTRLEPNPMNPDHVVVLVGAEEWPFAVPLVRKNGRWYFDVGEGKAEIRNRIIGGNELDAIEVCRGFVEAQEMYTQTDWDASGVKEYAKRIVSNPGKKTACTGREKTVRSPSDSPARSPRDIPGRLPTGRLITVITTRCSTPRDRLPRTARENI